MSSPVSSSPSPTTSSSLLAHSIADAPEVRFDQIKMEESVDTEPEVRLVCPKFKVGGTPSDEPAEAVKNEVEDTSSDSNAVAVLANDSTVSEAAPDVDLNSVIQAILGPNVTLVNNPHFILSTLLASLGFPMPALPAPTGTEPTGKKARLKVYSKGFFMTFDKVSSCKTKLFWRCERKNTCKARMHTDVGSKGVISHIHDHNHIPPTAEEVCLYGLDPSQISPDHVYIVGNVADPNKRRKIRKQVADTEAARKRLEEQQQAAANHDNTINSMVATRVACADLSSLADTSSATTASLLQAVASSGTALNPAAMLLAQLPFMNPDLAATTASYLSPSLPMHSTTPAAPPMNLLGLAAPALPAAPAIPASSSEPSTSRQGVKRRASEMDMVSALKQEPLFAPTFAVAHKLRKLWERAEPERYPRTSDTTTPHFDFFLADKNVYDDNGSWIFYHVHIEERNETLLKDALQRFSKQQCVGMLLVGVSPKINIMLNQPMLASWVNNQCFVLDTSNPSRWRLSFVDQNSN